MPYGPRPCGISSPSRRAAVADWNAVICAHSSAGGLLWQKDLPSLREGPSGRQWNHLWGGLFLVDDAERVWVNSITGLLAFDALVHKSVLRVILVGRGRQGGLDVQFQAPSAEIREETLAGTELGRVRGRTPEPGQLRQPPRNRDYRKLHFGVDEETGEVVACNLTSKNATDASRVPALLRQVDRPIASMRADSQYDAEVVYEAVESHRKEGSPRVLVPPKNKARIKPESPTARERNRNIRSRAQLGKRDWHQKSGYSLRAKAETTVSRYKIVCGPAMRARRLAAQRAEATIRCQI